MACVRAGINGECWDYTGITHNRNGFPTSCPQLLPRRWPPYVHRQVNTSAANADNTVPPHCSGLSAAACLFTSCCRRGNRTDRTGHELLMSFCPISTNKNKQKTIARGEKCFIVVHRIGSHVVPFVQQDNTVHEKEQDIISVVSSQHFCLESFTLDQPSGLDSRQYHVFSLQCFVHLHVCLKNRAFCLR